MRLLARPGFYLLFALIAATAATAQTPGPFTGIPSARVQQVAAMLPEKPTGFGPPCSDRAAWAPLAAQFQPQIKHAESLLTQSFPAWSDDAYLDFTRTGSRKLGEQMLGARQAWLAPLVLAECAEGRGRFLPTIAMVLDQISSQKSWTLPAHDGRLDSYSGKRYFVELNSATLSHEIAETLYLLGNQLPVSTRKHAEGALEQRIFAPMRNSFSTDKGQSWLTLSSNWTAVCYDGVTGAALAVLPSREDRALFVAAAELYAPNYLRSFTDDGYGVEGIGYWGYGFSHYADLREALWSATNGKLDLYSNPKARKVALFSIQLQMLPGNYAAFGDAHFMAVPSAPLVAYVERTFSVGPNTLITAPPAPFSSSLVDEVRAAFPDHSALPAQNGDDALGLRTYYPDPGVLIARPAPGGNLAVTIKAGGNGGHSHNDIGSFVIALGNTQPVGDPGGPNFYTADTFSKKRLTSRLLNSYGHPVPVIGGMLQKDATQLNPKILSTSFTPQQDAITIDMTTAYDAPTLKSLARTMKYSRTGKGSVEISDNFKLSAPTDIDESLPTHGTWRQIDAKTLEFTIDANAGKEHGPVNPNAPAEHLRVTIKAPTSFTVTDEKINDYGNPFTRVAIHLHLDKSGTVTLQFTPAS